jgi:hypothetical protein
MFGRGFFLTGNRCRFASGARPIASGWHGFWWSGKGGKCKNISQNVNLKLTGGGKLKSLYNRYRSASIFMTEPTPSKDLTQKFLDYTKDRDKITDLKVKIAEHASKEVGAFKLETQIYLSNQKSYYDAVEQAGSRLDPKLSDAQKSDRINYNAPELRTRLAAFETASERRENAFQALREKAGEVLKEAGLLYSEDTIADSKNRDFIKEKIKSQPVHPEHVIIDQNTGMSADNIVIEMAQDIQKKAGQTFENPRDMFQQLPQSQAKNNSLGR